MRRVHVSHPEEKSKRVGWLSGLASGPVVGWKRRSTGAVWSWSCFQSSAPYTSATTNPLIEHMINIHSEK